MQIEREHNLYKKQGQTVHKLQIATFWDVYIYIYISPHQPAYIYKYTQYIYIHILYMLEKRKISCIHVYIKIFYP